MRLFRWLSARANPPAESAEPTYPNPFLAVIHAADVLKDLRVENAHLESRLLLEQARTAALRVELDLANARVLAPQCPDCEEDSGECLCGDNEDLDDEDKEECEFCECCYDCWSCSCECEDGRTS